MPGLPSKDPIFRFFGHERGSFALPNEPFRIPKRTLSQPERNPFVIPERRCETLFLLNVLIINTMRKFTKTRPVGRKYFLIAQNENMEHQI